MDPDRDQLGDQEDLQGEVHHPQEEPLHPPEELLLGADEEVLLPQLQALKAVTLPLVEAKDSVEARDLVEAKVPSLDIMMVREPGQELDLGSGTMTPV